MWGKKAACQTQIDSAGWMLHVGRWRGLLGLELAVFIPGFSWCIHPSTSALNVLFMLSSPLLFPPPLPNVQLITASCTPPLCSLLPKPQLHSKELFFPLFIFNSLVSSLPSPTTVLFGGSQGEKHLTLNHRSPTLTDRSRQREHTSRAPPWTFHDRAWIAKWLTTVQNNCHITCSCSLCRPSPNQTGRSFCRISPLSSSLRLWDWNHPWENALNLIEVKVSLLSDEQIEEGVTAHEHLLCFYFLYHFNILHGGCL